MDQDSNKHFPLFSLLHQHTGNFKKINTFKNWQKLKLALLSCINKIQQDATVCRYLFTAKSLYKQPSSNVA